MNTAVISNEIKNRLATIYGKRLEGVVVFGSEARGDARPDSDIDFLVLLEGPVRYGEELRRIIDALYPLQLEVLRPLHPIPVEKKTYEKGEFSLYRTAKKEGIAA